MSNSAFFSRRNQVYPVLWRGRPSVEKHFTVLDDWHLETALYAGLDGRLLLVPVLYQRPGLLVTEYVPCPTLLEVLEAQERTGFSPEPWLGLAAWLTRCRRLCGRLPREGNLRNFLWDGFTGRILGLDLEDFRALPLSSCGAAITASLLSYEPADTWVKERAAALLTREMGVPESTLAEARRQLWERRKRRTPMPLSGVVLAGGASRRMGTGKAGLPLEGKTLLAWQAEKLRSLGIQDILLSGGDCPELPGARVIPDKLPGRGPLGGLYSCFLEAKNSHCLVLSVDTPLVPPSALAKLVRDGAVLRHAGKPEPLIGVYDTSLAEALLPMIKDGGAPSRVLEAFTSSYFDYAGPEAFLINCNTPREFSQARDLVNEYKARGLPLS